jgi:hypothetical protein
MSGDGTGTYSVTATAVDSGFVLGTPYITNAAAGSISPTWTVAYTGNGKGYAQTVSFTKASRIPAPIYALVQEVDNFATAPTANMPILTTTMSVTKGHLCIAWLRSSSLNYSSVSGGAWQVISDDHNAWIPIYGASRFIEQSVGGALPLGYSSYGQYATISAWYCIATRTETLSIQFFDTAYGGSQNNTATFGSSANGGPINGGTYGSSPGPLTDVWCQLMEFSGNSLVPFFGKDVESSLGAGSGTSAIAMIPGTENCLTFAAATADSEAHGYTTSIGAGFSDPTGTVHPANSAQYKLANGGGQTLMGLSTTGTWQIIGASFLPNTAPQHTLSGALGASGAGATVACVNTTTLYVQYATADSSGNYNISLYDGKYQVTPEVVGTLYTALTITLSGANVTKNYADFSGTACNANLIPTIAYTDTFVRANGDAGYQGDGGVPPGDPTVDVLNNECVMRFASASGMVTTNGTSVTWSSGDIFQPGWHDANITTPTSITINGVVYSISGTLTTTGLTLATTAGVQASPVAYSVSGIIWNWTGPYSAGGIPHATTFGYNTGANGYEALKINALSSACLSYATIGHNAPFMSSLFNLGDGTMTVRSSNYTPYTPSISENLVVPQGHSISDGTRIYQPSFTYKVFPFALGDTMSAANIGTVNYILHNGKVVANWGTNGGSGSIQNASWFMYGQKQPDAKVGELQVGSVVQAFAISGNAGVPGATISYSGATSGSVTADGSGNYTLPNLANGMYTITPTKTGYTFSPVGEDETISNGNITGANFSGTLTPIPVPSSGLTINLFQFPKLYLEGFSGDVADVDSTGHLLTGSGSGTDTLHIGPRSVICGPSGYATDVDTNANLLTTNG